MVALRNERRVFLWHLFPQPAPAEAKKTVTLDEIVKILEQEHTAGRARVYLSEGGNRFLETDDENRNEKNQLYIAQIRRGAVTRTVTILFNRGDPNAVSTAYLNTEKNTVRVDPPTEDEVPGWSAHLVISTVAHKGRHKACFEKMPRVSSNLVMNALDRFVGQAVAGSSKYRYEVNVKTKGKIGTRQKPYRPTLDVQRVPSEKLVDDLEQGELSGVTITKKTNFYSGVGRGDLIKYQEQKITIKTAPAEPETVKEFLGGFLERAKSQGYTSVTFHLEKLPKGQTNNPTITLDDHDALEQLYCRAQVMDGFKEFLEALYPAICDAIEAKMISVVNSRNW